MRKRQSANSGGCVSVGPVRQCPSCGRQLEGDFQFCPYDRTPLGRKCPACGKMWDASFQFCPVDSTELGGPAVEKPVETRAPVVEAPVRWEEPAPEPVPLPVTVPPPIARPALAADFSFTEQVAARTWKTIVYRPVTIIFIVGTLLVGAAVYLLTQATGGVDLDPPVVKQELLPAEGKGQGVPVAIKVNRLAVFLIDDPMEDNRAKRAQQIVAAVQEAMKNGKVEVGLRFAVEVKDGRPAVLVVTQAGPDPRVLVSVTDGDVALAGETDPARVAARWAERLTDAVKVYVFGEAPTFSRGTDFGEALLVLYKGAVSAKGKLSSKSLERSYQALTPAQKQALETPPRVR